MTLDVWDAILTDLIDQIGQITKYVNYRSKIAAKIPSEQCNRYTRDQIVHMTSDCPTRWHSKLRVIEKYIILKPILEKVFPPDAPSLLSKTDEEVLAEGISVMNEVRRVARYMEFDRKMAASRTPRLLK